MISAGFCLLFLNFLGNVFSDEVLGCGGFVKSHVPIDFSRVQVKLLTKNGILKDKINAAPNNGYYFVLLYDKGEYTLELEPPPGWSFTPTKVDLIVDGVSDDCALGKDINFVFNGFGITGKVESLGAESGPSGIEIELKSTNEKRKTVTGDGGVFFFTPVYPGTYTVTITKSKWKVYKHSVDVVVAEGNTELPPRSLIMQGYDVSGYVKNGDDPIKDAIVLLYSKDKQSAHVEGCEKTELKGLDNDKPICFARTNNEGLFTFGVVPNGDYFIKPHYLAQNIHYQPKLIEFTVNSGSLLLEKNLEIVGFSVIGRVVKSLNGKPIANAQVILDDREVTKTNHQGVFKLEKMKAGTYNIKAAYDGFLFDAIVTKLNPSSSQVNDLIPTYYRVCGYVLSDKSHQVTFSSVGSTRLLTTESDPVNGRFCQYLQRGKYHVQAIVTSEDSKKGLQFFPNHHTIEVTSDPIDNIQFSQLKATVAGKVKCLNRSNCDGLKVTLRLQSAVPQKKELVAGVIDGTYKIGDIYPGIYEVTLSHNELCWKEDKQIVNVNNVNIEVPTFQQTGYIIVFSSSHDTELKYKTNEIPEKSIKVSKGRSSHCLEKAGVYTFEMNSCHSYASNIMTLDTQSAENEISLNALKHTVTLGIQGEKVDGVTASITIDGITTQRTLTHKNNAYRIELLLSPGQSATIVPHSDLLYFTPPSFSLEGSEDCVDLGTKMKGISGAVFQGKITPPLSGVVITVESHGLKSLSAETDDKGYYKFPPLDKSKPYKVSAKKESYVLVGPDENGNFLAHKLAEIVIDVADSESKPLQGTLLSLSGGDSYRSNLQTNDDGRIIFNSLSPGDYFLRPMMKEYSFEPTSKIIKVNEGQTANVKLIGKRVAYSAFGQVTSLNKEPEEHIPVVAHGLGNCSHYSEESTSEYTGNFRIRGLQPYCSYDITIKNTEELIERSAPKTIHVGGVTSDIKDLQLVIFRAVTTTNLLVKVYAKNTEHYKGIRVKLLRDSSVVHIVKLDPLSGDVNNGVLIEVPAIPMDSKLYTVQLESNLNRYDSEKKQFTANKNFVYVELDFSVRSNVAEQEIKQTSVWTLVFIFAVMVLVYNIDTVSQVLKERFGSVFNDLLNSAIKKNTVNEYPMDNDDIDQIVQRINAVKKKKPKKI